MWKTIMILSHLVATSYGSDSSSFHISSSTNSGTNGEASPSAYQRSPWSVSTSASSGEQAKDSASSQSRREDKLNGNEDAPPSCSRSRFSETPSQAAGVGNGDNKPISTQAALGIIGHLLPDWSSTPVNAVPTSRRQGKEPGERVPSSSGQKNEWARSSSSPDEDNERRSPTVTIERRGPFFNKLNTNHSKRAGEQLLRSLKVGLRLLNEVKAAKIKLDRHADEICEASRNKKQICSEAKDVNTLPNMEAQFMTNEGFYQIFKCHSVKVRIACDIFVRMDVLSCPDNYLVATGPEPGCFFYFARNRNSGKRDVRVLGQACHDGSSMYESNSEGGESVSNDIPETSTSPIRTYTPPMGNEHLRTKDGFRIPPLPKKEVAATSSKAEQSATSKLNANKTNAKGKEKMESEPDCSSLITRKIKFKSQKNEIMPNIDVTRMGPKIRLPQNQLTIDSPQIRNEPGSKNIQMESLNGEEIRNTNSTRKEPKIRFIQNQLLPTNSRDLKNKSSGSREVKINSHDDIKRTGPKVRLPKIVKSFSRVDVGTESQNARQVMPASKKRASEERNKSKYKILKGKHAENKANGGRKFSSQDYANLFQDPEVMFSEKNNEKRSRSKDKNPEIGFAMAHGANKNIPKRGRPRKDGSSGKNNKNISGDPEIFIIDSKEASPAGSSSQVRPATNDLTEFKLKRGRPKINLSEKKSEARKNDSEKLSPKSKSVKSFGSGVGGLVSKKCAAKENEENSATYPEGILISRSNIPDGNFANSSQVLKPKISNGKKLSGFSENSDTLEKSLHSNSETSDTSHSRKIKKSENSGNSSNKNEPKMWISSPSTRNEKPAISEEPMQIDIEFIDPPMDELPVQSKSVDRSKSIVQSVRTSKLSKIKTKEMTADSGSDSESYEESNCSKNDPNYRMKHAIATNELARQKSDRPKRVPKSYNENYISR